MLQENRLKENDLLKTKYTSFMNEYLQLGHMNLVSDSEMIREDSLTTDVRVMFEATVKTQSGKSLNDIQLIGSRVQNDIFGILMRFREHRFVVIADVAKMYRQILIHPEERFLQSIVWRNSPDDNLSVYELQTVTYGTSSAPYLAIKCLKKLAVDNRQLYPEASELIDRDMYVDDLITGFDTEHQAIVVCEQISNILRSASFSLRKWASNSNSVLKHLQDESEMMSILELGENEGEDIRSSMVKSSRFTLL